MISNNDIFCEIPCLTEHSIGFRGTILQKKWFKSSDRRYLGQTLQKFVSYNLSQFHFLGVEPIIAGSDQNTSIYFKTSSFIGVIPLRGSDTGKQIGDFVVVPRFTGANRYEDYIEIVNLIGDEAKPEIGDSLPLLSGKNFRPPLYLEAIKFLSSLEKLLESYWKKFNCVEKITSEPIGRVNWNRYLKSEFKVEKRLAFPIRKNTLSELHEEYSMIKYVFDICFNELNSANTPQRIKHSIAPKLNVVSQKMHSHFSKKCSTIKIRASDAPAIKLCKEHANNIKKYDFIKSTAWRVDFSLLFEKYVQYIFNEVAKERGAKFYPNFKLRANRKRQFNWELQHLEPDAVFKKGESFLFIDAKYKPHLYNKFDPSESLKETHRHDLHQIIAYSSFSSSEEKYGVICYPSQSAELKRISYKNPINLNTSEIFILGVPVKKSEINNVAKLVNKIVNEI